MELQGRRAPVSSHSSQANRHWRYGVYVPLCMAREMRAEDAGKKHASEDPIETLAVASQRKKFYDANCKIFVRSLPYDVGMARALLPCASHQYNTMQPIRSSSISSRPFRAWSKRLCHAATTGTQRATALLSLRQRSMVWCADLHLVFASSLHHFIQQSCYCSQLVHTERPCMHDAEVL